jgi:hypothetical protein
MLKGMSHIVSIVIIVKGINLLVHVLSCFSYASAMVVSLVLGA